MIQTLRFARVLTPLTAMLSFLAPATSRANTTTVPIHTVADLYSTVQDPANVDAILLLDGVTFDLGTGGPLVLQPGMALVGQAGTVIDGSKVTVPGQSGLLQIGRDNRIEGLTIKGPPSPATVIDAFMVDPQTSNGISVEIRNSVIEGSARGIFCRHTSAVTGVESRALIEGTTVRNARGLAGSAALHIQNMSSSSRWNVTLRNNHFTLSHRGLIVAHLSNDDAENTVLSMRNVYDHNNSVGIDIIGCRDNRVVGANLPCHRAYTRFDSVEDVVRDNYDHGMAPRVAGQGGVLVFGALHTDTTTTTGTPIPASTDNRVRIQLLGTSFAGNQSGLSPSLSRSDVTIFGAVGNQGISPGTGNEVVLLMRGSAATDADGAFTVDDSSPDDATLSNKVTIVGADVAFEQTNPAFVAFSPDE